MKVTEYILASRLTPRAEVYSAIHRKFVKSPEENIYLAAHKFYKEAISSTGETTFPEELLFYQDESYWGTNKEFLSMISVLSSFGFAFVILSREDLSEIPSKEGDIGYYSMYQDRNYKGHYSGVRTEASDFPDISYPACVAETFFRLVETLQLPEDLVGYKKLKKEHKSLMEVGATSSLDVTTASVIIAALGASSWLIRG